MVINSSNKKEFKIIYYDNVVLCVKIDAKTDTSKLTLTWWSTQKWNVTLVLTTLNKTISLGQEKIMEDIFKCFGVEECKLVSIAFDVTSKLCKIDKPMTIDEANKIEGVPYEEEIGCVMFVMIATRLDIIVVIGVVSKFTKS